MPSSHLILCLILSHLLLLPSIPPSIRVFSSESALRMSWPKYWSFSFSISPSKEIPGLISFRMDWLETLKSLLRHDNSKASILQCSAFFMVSSVQLLSRVRLCDPMNRSTPDLPVLHQLPEFTQTHVHRVGDAIQSSYPLSSPSSPAPNPSQHQGLFQWVNSLHEVAKVLEFQL